MKLYYDGTEIEEAFGCAVFRIDTDLAPGRLYNRLEIPGRSGELLLDEQRYPNVDMSYTAVFYGDGAEASCKGLINFLLSKVGYKRLQDGDHSESGDPESLQSEFYQAFISADLEPAFTRDRSLVKLPIEFSRKPQRYLVSGEEEITLTADGSVTNPTLFEAKPIIVVTGTGELGIGSQTVTVTGVTPVTIDCEMMDCYQGAYSRNNNISFSDYKFPVLKPGTNNFTLGGNISKAVITPRWWRL